MRISLKSLFALTLVMAIVAAMFVWARNSTSTSWGTSIAHNSAVDNPGYALFVSEIEAHLAAEGFLPADAPSFSGIAGSRNVSWFRSEKYPEVYACTYADLRSYSAKVTANVRGRHEYATKLRAYSDKLVDDFQAIWDSDRHELHQWGTAEPSDETDEKRPSVDLP